MKHPSAFIIIAVMVVVPLIFIDTTLSMINVWNTNETFTHGFLIFPISLWLLWLKRLAINSTSTTPEPLALILIVPALLLWLISYAVDVNVTQQIAMVSLIPLSILLLLGRKLFLVTSFPLLYLFFSVPLGQSLIPPLMEFTAFFSVNMIQLSGIPIYQEGLSFILPSGNWSVVEECSGVRYLIASLALGTIYAYLNYNSYRKRLIFILISIVVPILANGLRAYMIVMIGHLSGMKYAVGADHLLYGWVFFGIVIFLMFYIGSFWMDPEPKIESTGSSMLGASTTFNVKNRRLAVVSIVLIGFLTTTRIYSLYLSNSDTEINSTRVSLADHFGSWVAVDQSEKIWSPVFKNPNQNISSTYQLEERQVQLDIGYYFNQKDGAEAVTSLNRLTNPYDEEDWKITSSTNILKNGLKLKETTILKHNRKILIWSWYQIGSEITASPYAAKVYQVYHKIIHDRDDASMVTISTSYDQKIDEPRASLWEFFNAANNQLVEQIERPALNHQ
jgi:exosortase A